MPIKKPPYAKCHFCGRLTDPKKAKKGRFFFCDHHLREGENWLRGIEEKKSRGY